MNDRLTGARSTGFPEPRIASKPRFEAVAVSGRQIRPLGESTRNPSFVGGPSRAAGSCLIVGHRPCHVWYVVHQSRMPIGL